MAPAERLLTVSSPFMVYIDLDEIFFRIIKDHGPKNPPWGVIWVPNFGPYV